MVQFQDGSIKAQMGLPDMKLPILYAMGYPHRHRTDFPRFDFAAYPALTFEAPDVEAFPNLGLAFDAMKRGGNAPCVLNAANEVAVAEFLAGNIGFNQMPELISRCLDNIPFAERLSLEAYVETDREARSLATRCAAETRVA
jgi:1-deoxy-D-xylulose-5-phosphate reductoisomerase